MKNIIICGYSFSWIEHHSPKEASDVRFSQFATMDNEKSAFFGT